jgi:hypothetical protein
MPSSRGHSFLTILCLLILGACAPKLTLSQEITWDAYKACIAEGPGTQLERVYEDGRWYVTGREGDIFKVSNCMQRYWRDNRQRTTASVAPSQGGTAAVAAAPMSFAAPPQWRPGDEWSFREEGSRSNGTFVWSVVREEATASGRQYVVQSGSRREIYYRAEDLAYLMDKVDGDVETSSLPGDIRYVWPLDVGRRWEFAYTVARPKDRTTEERKRECVAEKEETVTVPAGTFQTVKVVCRNPRTGRPTHEAWYAPAVKHYVKWLGHWTDGVQTRELTGFRLK